MERARGRGVAVVFTVSGTGVGQASIVNADGSANATSNPASGINLHNVPSRRSAGAVVAGPANILETPVVQIGGVKAQMIYAGAAPGEVDGVVQLNVLIPASLTPCAAPTVVISINGLSSQSGATIAVNSGSLRSRCMGGSNFNCKGWN